jgi:hypothetical protein
MGNLARNHLMKNTNNAIEKRERNGTHYKDYRLRKADVNQVQRSQECPDREGPGFRSRQLHRAAFVGG